MTATADTEMTPAQKARAERLAAKQTRSAATTTKGGRAAGTVTPAPKPTKKATAKAEKDTAQARAEAAAAKAAREAEAEAKRVAAAAAKEKRDAEKAAKAEEKAKRDAEREAKRTEREAAKAEREKAREPQIMGSEFPSELITVKVEDVRNLPEVVGAQPSARFVKSIKDHGVLEPITMVRATEDSTEIRLAGGRRRIMAAVLAGIAEVPAVVYTVGDKFGTWGSGATIHLNMLRSENVAADLQAIKALQGDYTNEQIARETGMPLGTVKKRVRLLGLPDRFLALLYSGKVAHTVLTEASGLTAAQLDDLYKVYETTGKISRKDVDALRRANRADAADGLDFDSMMDGAPGAGDVTEPRTVAPIRNTGDLPNDVLSFLSAAAAQSGITFSVDGAGVVTLTRGDQTVEFQGRAGVVSRPASAPAVAPEITQTPDEQIRDGYEGEPETPAEAADREFAEGFDQDVDADDTDPA